MMTDTSHGLAAFFAAQKMEPTPVVRDTQSASPTGTGGEVVVRNRMSLTLACDHRILYGAQAAEFLGRIQALLEQPLALAL
jgi:pyruvate dehydrogenase E2 component (dihydrolipoamide acetyltransferase)